MSKYVIYHMIEVNNLNKKPRQANRNFAYKAGFLVLVIVGLGYYLSCI